ncbi:porin [Shewanella violacea]|uniref:Outer membrane porin, putative n=1 Tax=Shewanella violacea (strain JCM 10179 / CIP 106290 / LMG 19151 / DSS12) TaxID=637905 RepID=D4ZC39_SHEVD|nr:porin [Shewanella violacea]BAJ03584.1 outer membrane porin, putative [Shewanella violacea DSS12]
MKKTLLASALSAVIFAPSVAAIEIYKDDKNAVEIGGFVDARVINTQGATEVVNGASRINFGFTREMSDGWKAFTKLEWGVNPFGNSEIVYSSESNFESKSGDFLNNRLGYVGIGHDKYGTLSIGKQWGAWYDVVYNTNYGFVWDGNAAGVYTYNKADGAVNGTGRGDKVVQYRNSFGDVSFAIQAQLKHDTFYTCEPAMGLGTDCEARWNASEESQEVNYDYTYGGSITYQATDMLTLTAGINRGEFDVSFHTGDKITATDLIYGVGATWGGFDTEGFYAAANFNKNENHDTDNLGRLIKDSYGIESLFSYKYDNGLRTFISYNVLDAGSDYVIQPNSADPKDVFKRQFVVVGLHYVWDSSTVLYVEARKDYSNFTSADKEQEARMSISEDDGVAIGIRYTL